MKRILIFLPLLLSCQKDYYKEAEILEKNGRILEAASYYEKYASVSNDDILRPKAINKAADIYSSLNVCSKSSPLWEELARKYPSSSFSAQAEKLVYICPRYFPYPDIKKIIYGDSQTYGKNAREELTLKKQAFGGGFWEHKIYAGKKIISKGKTQLYEKDLTLYEKKDKDIKKIIKYPIKTGEEISYGGKKIYVSQSGLTVKTKAGEFSGCVKIYEYDPSQSSFKQVFYYAPELGKIITAIESSGKETRITEIISYERK
ncbi:MAG: hypothetical protein GX447_00300 [Elusimicrobia bacterium]|nr:hypothetical protein [Elusimicrobiota bacterium]